MKRNIGTIALNVYLSCVMAWMVAMIAVLIYQLFMTTDLTGPRAQLQSDQRSHAGTHARTHR